MTERQLTDEERAQHDAAIVAAVKCGITWGGVCAAIGNVVLALINTLESVEGYNALRAVSLPVRVSRALHGVLECFDENDTGGPL